MDAGAAAIARALLVLGRAGASGVLTVDCESVRADLGVRAGQVVSSRMPSEPGESLGEILRAMGAWQGESGPLPHERLGEWALRVGVTDEPALSAALRRQLRMRLCRLFGLGPVELRLRTGSPDVGLPELREPVAAGELIMNALRERVEDVPALLARKRLGDGVLVSTGLGRELLAEATLWPEEQAMVSGLERGATVEELLRAAAHRPRAIRALLALRQVGACAPPSPRAAFTTLLRKKRQLRGSHEARALLDLPPSAGTHEARGALRRLASAVHPDRFGPESPAAIRAASNEVMRAIVQAQQRLQGGRQPE